MDAFYASVELRRRPELRGKPVVVCGSGPRAVVTTASYEARKLAGIHSAMPAAVARRRLPDAVYLRPDFPAYREASAQVMEVLRRNVEMVEVVGLDEAYLDLTGLFSPKATMRRIATEIRARHRPHLLGRDLREPDAGQDHQRAGQAGGAGRALARGGAGALRRRLPRPDPRDRAEDGAQAAGDGDPHARRPARPRARGARSRLRAPLRRLAARPRPALGRDADHASRARPNRSRRRPPSTSTYASAASWSATSPSSPRSSAGACASASSRAARSGSRSGSTTGPTSPARTRSSEPTNDPAVVGPVALDLLRAYDPQRPVRLLGVRVASFENDDGRRGGRARAARCRLSLPSSGLDRA